MTFHLTHQGNSYVNRAKLAEAIDQQDDESIIKALQGTTIPNPVAFLTNGRQHCVELISGHCLEVQGAGHVELSEHFGALTHSGLASALNTAKTAYGGKVEYSESK